MTSLLNLLFSSGPTGGPETPAMPGSPNSGVSGAFASSLAGLLDSTPPSQARPSAELDLADAATQGLHQGVDDGGNPLPAAGNERQFLAAPAAEAGKQMSPHGLPAEQAAGLRRPADENPVLASSAPRVPGPQSSKDGAIDQASRTAAGLTQRGAAASSTFGTADSSAAAGLTSSPVGTGGFLRAAGAASRLAATSIQTPSTSGVEVVGSSAAPGDGALKAVETADQSNRLRGLPRVDNSNPRLHASASGTDQAATPVGGASRGLATGTAAGASPGLQAGQMDLNPAALVAGMARPPITGASSGRQMLGLDPRPASTSGIESGNRSALGAYGATLATSVEAGKPGTTLGSSNRLPTLESGGLPATQGSVPGPAPAGTETTVTEPLQIVRSTVSMAESVASAKSAEAPTSSGLSLANGQEAAETLVQRMLQNQAQQLSSIRFQLRPAELGHLDVQMQWRGDQLQLAFTAQHAAARDLIEGYLPQLRQLMQDMGLQLAGVDVRLDPDAKDGAQRQLQQQLGQNLSQNQSQNPGQGAGQQAAAQRDPQGQELPEPSGPSAADGGLETGNSDAGDSPAAEVGLDRPLVVIDAFV